MDCVNLINWQQRKQRPLARFTKSLEMKDKRLSRIMIGFITSTKLPKLPSLQADKKVKKNNVPVIGSYIMEGK